LERTTKHIAADQIRQEYRLVEAAKQNPQRFGVLYERYYKQIFLFVYKRVGEEDPAADVTSQVFLKAMLNLKKYKFKGVPFSAWLYRIAVNEVNQYFRETKAQRQVNIESSQLPALMEEIQEVLHEDQMPALVAMLDQLPPDDLQMVELRFFEKLPFAEIAEILNITENNAKVRMYRILGRMKKQYQQANFIA
jgi:RNA polymerase sigma-70 factor (ECF subfamily)